MNPRIVSVFVITRVDFLVAAPKAKAPAPSHAKDDSVTLSLVLSSGSQTHHKFKAPTLKLVDSILGGHALVMVTNGGEALFFVERPATSLANPLASVEANRIVRGPVLLCSLADAKKILANV